MTTPSKKKVIKKAAAKKTAAKKTAVKKAAAKKAAVKETAIRETVVNKAPSKRTAGKAAKKAAVASADKVAKAGEGTSPASMVGKKAPRFRLRDQSGQMISSEDFKGKPYVLYFYPKDNTPGCTKESCDFRDELRNFQRSGVTVLGVSPDSEKSHAGFAEKYGLPFSLLSDPDKELAQAYGVWALKQNYGRQYWGIVRSTFLVDSSGRIKKEWLRVKVDGHAGKVLAEARA